MHRIQQDFAEGAAISQKEDRQKPEPHQQPCLFRHFGHAEARALCESLDFVAVAGDILAKQIDRFAVPAVLLPQLFRELAGA